MPALSVGITAGQEVGRVHYIIVQVDEDPRSGGPTIQFSEIALGGGSAVGSDWKDGVREAVIAAADAVGQDPRRWVVTIRNRSRNSLTDGSSASSVVAVAIMSAWRGDQLQPGVALTGTVSKDGRIGEVDNLPSKLEGAAKENMHTLLVPQGQGRTADWDLYQQGKLRNIKVLEVSTLRDAYEVMTGKRP